MQYTYVGENHQKCLHHSHKHPGITSVWCVLHRIFVCECIQRMCMCMCLSLCVWCMTRWVSWVCWWCLPKLQRGWRFSTNPASLEGLLILTTQFFSCILLLYQRGRMREKQVHRLFTKFALADRNKPSHFPCEASCRCSTNTQMSCILQLHPTLLLSLPFVIWSLSVCLSFPSSLAHSTHPSAALHCWRQQPGSPLYFWVPQIDTGR